MLSRPMPTPTSHGDVDRATAETKAYARVIATNATVKDLVLPPETDIRDLGTLP